MTERFPVHRVALVETYLDFGAVCPKCRAGAHADSGGTGR